jgi:hypothetical protein
MFRVDIAATQCADLRQDGPPEQVFGLLPGAAEIGTAGDCELAKSGASICK